ncbi:MAG: tetratricopeptide repeat-containing serine/threonine-protein kinase [Acidobacteriota bacterium]|nr:tetratricopeptide repeat-containing serine/threonine-protein kinase [Acidobacteriota bacterium]
MSLPAGTRIGPYEILAPVGAGGMGEVYRARDTRLDRDAAIKVLNADVALKPEARARFEREARAASSLSHPHVAHIYEIGDIGGDSGGRFIAMEFVDGTRLDQKMDGKPMPPDQIVEIGAAVADALDAAHAKGVIHRDIKPGNVMFTSRGQLKVLDFGLARIDTGQPVDDRTRSASQLGVILGTVQYMSPEQALGRAVDERTDLFSLGVMLYEMATGRLPFSGLTATETIERIAHAQPDAVSRFNYSISPELERIIRKCLEKDPDRRYQSARELLVDLRNLKRDSDGHVRPETAAPSPMAGMSRRALAAAPIALLLIGAAGWFGWTRLNQTAAIDSIVILPFTNSTGDPETEYLADGLSDTLIDNLSKLPNLRIVPRGIAFRFKGKDLDPRAIAQELNVAAVVMGRVTQRGSDVTVQAELIDSATLSRVWGGRYDRPMSALVGLQAELTQAIAQKIDPSLGRPEQSRLAARQTANSEAYQLYLKGRYHWNKRTETGLRLGLEHFRQAIDRDPAYAAAYAGQADCYSLLGRYQFEPPADSYPLARAAARKALELDDSSAEVHVSLAYVSLNYDYDWAGAERGYQRAISLDPNYATAHHWYGLLKSGLGEHDAALSLLAEAQRLEPLSGIIAANFGRVYYYAGRNDEALATHLKAMQLDPDFGEGLLRLGWVYDQLGRYDEAIAVYLRAMERAGTPVRGALGHAYARSGRTREALAVLADLESTTQRRPGDPYEAALVLVGLGRTAEAFRALDRAVDARSGMIVYARADPKLASLRSDPRFAALLARLKLP